MLYKALCHYNGYHYASDRYESYMKERLHTHNTNTEETISCNAKPKMEY